MRFGVFGQGTFIDFGATQPAVGTASADGFGGGASAGIDFRLAPGFILGGEIDASLGDARGSVNNASFGFDYLATLRGRIGFNVHPALLLYATGGVAFLGVEGQDSGLIGGFKANETLTGGIVGAGLEYDVGHMTLFTEYDYAGFGSRELTLAGTRHEIDADMHLFRLGVKFKIGHDHFDRIGRHYEPLK